MERYHFFTLQMFCKNVLPLLIEFPSVVKVNSSEIIRGTELIGFQSGHAYKKYYIFNELEINNELDQQIYNYV